jgi:Predicted phosphotransferase related to Ser/Thr protein kinases
VTYDITCLFKDAFLSWPEERVRNWLQDYWKLALPLGIPVQRDFEEFLRASDLMGVQRHLKVIGIFCPHLSSRWQTTLSGRCTALLLLYRSCAGATSRAGRAG